jgi:polysaccharide biosynthesis transport protein
MQAKTKPWSMPQEMSFSQQVHLTDYINIIRRRKWTVIIFFLVVVGLVAGVSFHTQPVYKATTQIFVGNQPSVLGGINEVTANNSGQQDYYQTQYNLLRSRSLVYKVIRDQELWKDVALGNTGNAHASMSLPSSSGGPESLPDQRGPTSEIDSMIADWYLSNLQITPVRGSRLVDVSFLGPSPEWITRVVNAHAHAFIEKNIQTQTSAAKQALDWLKTQLKDQKAKVEESQRTIYEYKKVNDIISLEERQNIVSQKLMELNSTLTRAKTEQMAKQAVYNQLKGFSVNRESLFSLPEISKNSVIQNLRAQLVQLKSQRLEMGTKFGPKHPRMIELNSSITSLEREIREEVQRLRKAIKAELDRSVAIEKTIQKTLDAQKQAAMAISEKAINYDVLQQQAESDQHIYDILLKQAKEISLTSVMESSNVRIVDPAEIPRFPVKPRIFLNILLAVVLGLFMGTGLAFFREYMDNTVKIPEDVPRSLGMPVLGAVPYDKSLNKRKTLALPQNTSGKVEIVPRGYPLYNITNRFPAVLQLTEQDTSAQVLMVESAVMGEGKTTVLAHLGTSLARAGLRLLMVDFDLHRPALHQILGVKNNEGLFTLMSRVLTHKISDGKLSEYSMDDLFFLMALKKQSGQLTVTNQSQVMTAVFQDGRLLHLQNQDNPKANRLGTMLLRGGFITKDQLEEVLERHQRTGQPLGYILINAGYMTQDKLQGPLRLQMEEHLQKLFSWKQGGVTFEPGRAELYENEKICFGEDYQQIIRRLGNLSGSHFLEKNIISRLKSVNESNAYVMTVGMAPPNWNGQVNLPLMAKIFDITKRRFDVILVDMPPVLDITGAAPLCALADGVIFVIKAGHMSVKILNQAKTGLSQAKANVVGAVLNQVKMRQDYYYK